MSIPMRDLPVVQNWDCHSCSDCCRIEAVITEQEKQRIEALDLANDSEIAPKPWFAPLGRGSKKWTLTHRPDGGCVFLTTANRCRLQKRFGAEAKPFVCRFVFRLSLYPRGNHWRVTACVSPLPVGRGKSGSAGGRQLKKTSCNFRTCWSNTWAGRRTVRPAPLLPARSPSFRGRMCAKYRPGCWWRSWKTIAIVWNGSCAKDASQWLAFANKKPFPTACKARS